MGAERADATGATPVVSRGVLFPAESAEFVRLERYRPSHDLAGLVRHYWIPRWSLPEGRTHEELLLQYATCNLVVSDDYAALFGLARGVGSRTLAGTGWAFGVMLQPATARILLDAGGGAADDTSRVGMPVADRAGRSTPAQTDASGSRSGAAGGDATGEPRRRTVASLSVEPGRRTVASLSEAPVPIAGLVPGAAEVTARIRSLREDDTGMIGAFEAWLRGLRLDAGRGAVINDVVRAVETEPGIRSVEELAARFGLGVRSLQRLTAEFVGMNPKWLLQRQRLQDAAARLREHPPAALADLAAELGYADQAHFSRDFTAAVGLAPGEYSRRTQVDSGRNVSELPNEKA